MNKEAITKFLQLVSLAFILFIFMYLLGYFYQEIAL